MTNKPVVDSVLYVFAEDFEDLALSFQSKNKTNNELAEAGIKSTQAFKHMSNIKFFYDIFSEDGENINGKEFDLELFPFMYSAPRYSINNELLIDPGYLKIFIRSNERDMVTNNIEFFHSCENPKNIPSDDIFEKFVEISTDTMDGNLKMVVVKSSLTKKEVFEMFPE
jgi:hypothetical protein